MNCKQCKREYSFHNVIRVYGEVIWAKDYCSAKCYTKKINKTPDKPFMLSICPAFEKDSSAYKEFYFITKKEMIAAKDCAADLLLFIQDTVKAMPDYTNSFDCAEHINGEWESIE